MTTKAIGKRLRFEVLRRDRFTCQYCGRKAPEVELQVDHVHPASDGGPAVLSNLVTSCSDCNSGKATRRLTDDVQIPSYPEWLEPDPSPDNADDVLYVLAEIGGEAAMARASSVFMNRRNIRAGHTCSACRHAIHGTRRGTSTAALGCTRRRYRGGVEFVYPNMSCGLWESRPAS